MFMFRSKSNTEKICQEIAHNIAVLIEKDIIDEFKKTYNNQKLRMQSYPWDENILKRYIENLNMMLESLEKLSSKPAIEEARHLGTFLGYFLTLLKYGFAGASMRDFSVKYEMSEWQKITEPLVQQSQKIKKCIEIYNQKSSSTMRSYIQNIIISKEKSKELIEQQKNLLSRICDAFK